MNFSIGLKRQKILIGKIVKSTG